MGFEKLSVKVFYLLGRAGALGIFDIFQTNVQKQKHDQQKKKKKKKGVQPSNCRVCVFVSIRCSVAKAVRVAHVLVVAYEPPPTLLGNEIQEKQKQCPQFRVKPDGTLLWLRGPLLVIDHSNKHARTQTPHVTVNVASLLSDSS